MTCKDYIKNQCQVVLEWQPNRHITERFCLDICQGRFSGDYGKLIAWARAKAAGQESGRPCKEKQKTKRDIECDKCIVMFCQFQKQNGWPNWCRLRNRPWAFCKENKWPENLGTAGAEKLETIPVDRTQTPAVYNNPL